MRRGGERDTLCAAVAASRRRDPWRWEVVPEAFLDRCAMALNTTRRGGGVTPTRCSSGALATAWAMGRCAPGKVDVYGAVAPRGCFPNHYYDKGEGLALVRNGCFKEGVRPGSGSPHEFAAEHKLARLWERQGWIRLRPAGGGVLPV